MTRNILWGKYIGAQSPLSPGKITYAAFINNQSLFITYYNPGYVGTIALQGVNNPQFAGTDLGSLKETLEQAAKDYMPVQSGVVRAHIANFTR